MQVVHYYIYISLQKISFTSNKSPINLSKSLKIHIKFLKTPKNLNKNPSLTNPKGIFEILKISYTFWSDKLIPRNKHGFCPTHKKIFCVKFPKMAKFFKILAFSASILINILIETSKSLLPSPPSYGYERAYANIAYLRSEVAVRGFKVEKTGCT
jgi:hypothetical protein